MELYSSAYNVWPADAEGRREFMAGLIGHGWLAGLELGYTDSLEWPDGAPDTLAAIVTGIPGTTARHAEDAEFGLASPDRGGRERALAWAREMAAAVSALNAEGHRIKAVQVHSAPTGKASPEFFAESLREMAGWDWGGAELWVEHCDAWVPGQQPNKGYLTVGQEIAVLDKVSAEVPDVRLGLVINWARSAIEGRSAETPLAHIRQAAASGWLRHVGFSSCSGEETAFGGPWADQHLPLAGTSVAPNGSLLGAEEVAAAVEAAGDVTYGLKISLRPKDQSAATKLAAIDENAGLVLTAGS